MSEKRLNNIINKNNSDNPMTSRRSDGSKNSKYIVQLPPDDVIPSTGGDFELTLLKMLIRTRKRVTRSVIRPGIKSGGIKKLA